MKEKKIELSEDYDSHFGLKAVTLTDNVGCRIVIHSPTNASPQWLQNMGVITSLLLSLINRKTREVDRQDFE